MTRHALPYYHFIPSHVQPRHFAELARVAKGLYARFDTEVPGVLVSLFGPSRSPHAGYFTHLRLAVFESFAAHEAYQATALHDEVVREQRRLVDDMVAADIENPRRLGPPARVFTLTLLKPRAGTENPESWNRALDRVTALRGGVPDLAFLELGRNLSPYARGWTHLLCAAFASPAACAAFETSVGLAEVMDALQANFAAETATIG